MLPSLLPAQRPPIDIVTKAGQLSRFEFGFGRVWGLGFRVWGLGFGV